jgi:3-isopropylmalate dehydrogenase
MERFNMSKKIVVLPGDGIGPEVIDGAVSVLKECGSIYSLDLEFEEFKVGGAALDEYGQPLPESVVESCLKADAVMLGAVGDPKHDNNPSHLRPEKALMGLRKSLGLYANLRPIITFDELVDSSPLKREIIEGVNILIVRELTGGIYFGEPRGFKTGANGRSGYNTEIYYDYEVERIARVAFDSACLRNGEVLNVDKSNVLESSQLWRSVVEEISAGYKSVKLEHILVDNCAMQLMSRPKDFDVILANNMFGDILSDEAAMLTGSIGMLASASLGKESDSGRIGIYEPAHGSAPDIAGQDKANPLATIGSAALLFRYSLQREDIARNIEAAIRQVIKDGHRTCDIAVPGEEVIGCREMSEKVLGEISNQPGQPVK